jgi:class 3 adenylate cyclase
MDFGWQQQEMAILFIDLRGFTRLVEHAESVDVIFVLHEYYAEIGRLSSRFHGKVGHVAGDGVMLFFHRGPGMPSPEARAVNLALAFRKKMEFFREAWAALDPDLDFGAGLASGQAVIGGIGADACRDFTIIGSAANLASRLCAQAQPGQILASRDFVSRVGDRVTADSLGRLRLKGLEAAVEAVNITGVRRK